jgi:vancomycin resistance protein VanJ
VRRFSLRREGSVSLRSELRHAWFRWVPPVASCLLCVALAVCYLTRCDVCAAVTIIPVWAWCAPGSLLAALGLRRHGNHGVAVVLGTWLIYLMAFAEEPRSIARATLPWGRTFQTTRPTAGTLRVISLNCAVGSRLAAAEVAPYRPDIVLLQESPGRREVEDLAHKLFGAEGGVVYGVDASLIVHGRADAAELPPPLRGYFVQARVTLTTGLELEVVSTRLRPAVFRLDLWSSDCWREQAGNRRGRREELRAIAQRIASSRLPVLVGGDFNAPQGDAVFRVLRPMLHDVFAEAGLGWGNTILNDVPVLRIDQLWASRQLRARAVVARPTRNSDHRMVIGDLTLEAKSD